MVDDLETTWPQYESARWLEVPRDTDAPYYCAPGMTPEETYAEVSQCLGGLFQHIRKSRHVETMPDVARISRWHRSIFHSTFPGTAGRFRAMHENDCRFGVWLPDGLDPAEWPLGSARGADCTDIAPRMEQALSAFRDSMPPHWRRARPDEVGKASAKLYTEILAIHPFVDGNMRLCNAVLQGAVRQFHYMPTGLLRAGDVEFARAYSMALRPDDQQTTDLLAELIARRIIKEQE